MSTNDLHLWSAGSRKEYHVAAWCNKTIKELSVKWLGALGYPNYSEVFNLRSAGRGLIHPEDRPWIALLADLIAVLRRNRTILVLWPSEGLRLHKGHEKRAKPMLEVNKRLSAVVDKILKSALALQHQAMQGRRPVHIGEDVTPDYANVFRRMVRDADEANVQLLDLSLDEIYALFYEAFRNHQIDEKRLTERLIREKNLSREDAQERAQIELEYKVPYTVKYTIRTDFYNKRAAGVYIRRLLEMITDIPLMFDECRRSQMMSNIEVAKRLNDLADDFRNKFVGEDFKASPTLTTQDIEDLCEEIKKINFIDFTPIK